MRTHVEENYFKFLGFLVLFKAFTDFNYFIIVHITFIDFKMPSTRAKAPISATKKKSLSGLRRDLPRSPLMRMPLIYKSDPNLVL